MFVKLRSEIQALLNKLITSKYASSDDNLKL